MANSNKPAIWLGDVIYSEKTKRYYNVSYSKKRDCVVAETFDRETFSMIPFSLDSILELGEVKIIKNGKQFLPVTRHLR